jgi:hypothetical protein
MNYTHYSHEFDGPRCGRCGLPAAEGPESPSFFPCKPSLGKHAKDFQALEPETCRKVHFAAVSLDDAVETAERWLAAAFRGRRTAAYVAQMRLGMPSGKIAVAYSPIE